MVPGLKGIAKVAACIENSLIKNLFSKWKPTIAEFRKAKPAWLLKVLQPSAIVTEALETPADLAPAGKLSFPAYTGTMHKLKNSPITDKHLNFAKTWTNLIAGCCIIAVRLCKLSVRNL